VEEEYSDEDDGYEGEEEEPTYRAPSKARAVGFVTPLRQPALVRNSLRSEVARNRYGAQQLTHFIFV
jgi:hypothetical protein